MTSSQDSGVCIAHFGRLVLRCHESKLLSLGFRKANDLRLLSGFLDEREETNEGLAGPSPLLSDTSSAWHLAVVG